MKLRAESANNLAPSARWKHFYNAVDCWCATGFGNDPQVLFKHTATHKQKQLLANEALRGVPKAEKKELLQELMGSPEQTTPTPAATHAKLQLGRHCEISLAGSYLLTWNLPEDWDNVPYQIFVHD